MIVGYGMPHYRFSADAMAELSLIASFELYFYLVSVCLCLSMVCSTGFDILNPLPLLIKFDDSMFLVLGLDRWYRYNL